MITLVVVVVAIVVVTVGEILGAKRLGWSRTTAVVAYLMTWGRVTTVVTLPRVLESILKNSTNDRTRSIRRIVLLFAVLESVPPHPPKNR